MSGNYIKNIAIIGGTGGIGKHFVAALLATARFQITAVSRSESTSPFPEGVKVLRGSYDDEAFLTRSFTGQDALVITLNHTVDPEIQSRMVRAAAKAGVPWVVPNEYGSDNANEALVEISKVNLKKKVYRDLVEELGVSKWIGVANNPFYGFSLSLGMFKIDIKNRKATLYDGGSTKFSASTFSTISQTVAKLLSLPIEGSSPGELSLSRYGNQFVYISSFRVSQRDILDAVQEVTGTDDRHWTIENESSTVGMDRAREKFATGDFQAMVDLLYISQFAEGLGGDFLSTHHNLADQLGVPKEDLVKETKAVVASLEQ